MDSNTHSHSQAQDSDSPNWPTSDILAIVRDESIDLSRPGLPMSDDMKMVLFLVVGVVGLTVLDYLILWVS